MLFTYYWVILDKGNMNIRELYCKVLTLQVCYCQKLKQVVLFSKIKKAETGDTIIRSQRIIHNMRSIYHQSSQIMLHRTLESILINKSTLRSHEDPTVNEDPTVKTICSL